MLARREHIHGRAEMDLKEFVADVISQVTDGVLEAINRHDERKLPGRINPVFPTEGGDYDWKSAVQNIDGLRSCATPHGRQSFRFLRIIRLPLDSSPRNQCQDRREKPDADFAPAVVALS